MNIKVKYCPVNKFPWIILRLLRYKLIHTHIHTHIYRFLKNYIYTLIYI